MCDNLLAVIIGCLAHTIQLFSRVESLGPSGYDLLFTFSSRWFGVHYTRLRFWRFHQKLFGSHAGSLGDLRDRRGSRRWHGGDSSCRLRGCHACYRFAFLQPVCHFSLKLYNKKQLLTEVCWMFLFSAWKEMVGWSAASTCNSLLQNKSRLISHLAMRISDPANRRMPRLQTVIKLLWQLFDDQYCKD